MVNEKILLNYVKDKIEDIIPFNIKGMREEFKVDAFTVDLLIDVVQGGINKKIICELKSMGEAGIISRAIIQLKGITSKVKNSYPLIIVPKISERSKEICRENDIGYLDMTGNCFIQFDNILIDKTGNLDLPEKLVSKKKKVKNIYSGKVTRILFALFERDYTQKELVYITGLTKGYVSRALATLEEKGIIKRDKKISLIDKNRVLNDFSADYDFFKNEIKTYYSFEQSPKKLMDRVKKVKLNYAFTLHAGASLIAPYIRFNDIYFYIKEKDLEKWIKLLELKPVEFGGNVHLIIPFNDDIFRYIQQINRIKVVSNIQLYLDLIKYPKRGKEQADYLRKEKIKW